MGEFTVALEDEFDSEWHLSVKDAAVDSVKIPSLIGLRLKQSKTYPFPKAINIFLGRIHRDLCPVSSMLAYLARHGSTPGPLFRLEPTQAIA